MAEEKQGNNTNTTKSIREAQKVSVTQLDKEMKSAAKILGEQKKVEVLIPAYLQKRVGYNVPVAVNGAVIHVPVGKKVKIPASMAALLNDSLAELKL